MTYYKIQSEDMFEDDNGVHVKLSLDYVTIKCSICQREATRITGVMRHPDGLDKNITKTKGLVTICEKCVPDYILVSKNPKPNRTYKLKPQ